MLGTTNAINLIDAIDGLSTCISAVITTCLTVIAIVLDVKEIIVEKYKEETDIEVLRQKAIQAEHSKATEQLSKQKNRIYNFRTVASGYYEK